MFSLYNINTNCKFIYKYKQHLENKNCVIVTFRIALKYIKYLWISLTQDMETHYKQYC